MFPDPYDWSPEDVKRWARRTFQEYQLPEQSAEEIELDGTSLCMLSEDDFKAKWPQFGEYIYVTLLWWKNGKYLTWMITYDKMIVTYIRNMALVNLEI